MKLVYVAAHGAGSDMNHRSMRQIDEVLRPHGFEVVRFNFPYRERGARVPDRMPVLKSCFEAIANRARGAHKLIIGGRSMGGRVATMMAAEGFACDGLLLFAYPLHPAGKPEKPRDAHLPRIRVPVLCFNGTRDPLCDRALMERALRNVHTRWDMHWLDGKDHAFPVTPEIALTARKWGQTLLPTAA